MEFETANYTDTGGRLYNEDCVRETYRKGALLTVVADGLGGHGGGSRASALAADEICQNWNGHANADEPGRLLKLAHRAVRGIQTPECAMKTTAVVLALEENRAAWAHAGDSRLYHFHNGSLVFQTRDHSASQVAVLLGEITPDQIRFHEDRSKILRALGQEGEISIDSSYEELAPGSHAFLLCSDGFWEYVLESEMEKDLERAANPGQWLALMSARLRKKIPKDNDNNTASAVWLWVHP